MDATWAAVVTGAFGLLMMLIEKSRRANTRDHNHVTERLKDMGSNLGRSIDRVEENMQSHLEHIVNKLETHDTVLFEHLASHAEVQFKEESVSVKRRKKQ